MSISLLLYPSEIIIFLFPVLAYLSFDYFNSVKRVLNFCRLAQDGSEKGITELVKYFTTKSIFQFIAFWGLSRLKSQESINILCGIWVENWDKILARILKEQNYFATTPVKNLVLTSLKFNSRENLITRQDTVLFLLESQKDKDKHISSRAREVLLNLKDQSAIDLLFKLFCEYDSDMAYQVIIEADYHSSNPNYQALIYFISERWNDYESLDFEQSLLKSIYMTVSEKLKKKILTHAQKNGRLEWFKLIDLKNSQHISYDQWDIGTQILLINKNFEKLWKNIFIAPPAISIKILKLLIENNWKPNPITSEDYTELIKMFQLIEINNDFDVSIENDFSEKFPIEGTRTGLTLISSFNNKYVIINGNSDSDGVCKYESVNIIDLGDDFASYKIDVVKVFFDKKIVAVDTGKAINFYCLSMDIDLDEDIKNTYKIYIYNKKVFLFKNLSYIHKGKTAHLIGDWHYINIFECFLIFSCWEWDSIEANRIDWNCDESWIIDYKKEQTSVWILKDDYFYEMITVDGAFANIDEKYLYLHPVSEGLPRHWREDYRDGRKTELSINDYITNTVCYGGVTEYDKFDDVLREVSEYSFVTHPLGCCIFSYLYGSCSIDSLLTKPLSEFSYEYLIFLEYLKKNHCFDRGEKFIDLVIYLLKLKMRYDIEVENFDVIDLGEFDIDIE